MSGHTPGPWRWSERTCDLHPQRAFDEAEAEAEGLGYVPTPDETIICTDSGYYPPRGADRSLIAAAPDLLEALERVLGTVEHTYHTNPDPDGSLWADVLACRAAIAKATTP